MKLARSLLFVLPPVLCAGWVGAQSAVPTGTVVKAELASKWVPVDDPAPQPVPQPDAQPDPKDPKALEFYGAKIQPLLAQSCLGCHSMEKHKGGLSMASRDAILKGGASGPAAVPGDPDKSLMIKAVRWADEDLKMPPRHKLSDEQIADLTQWVKLGLPYADAAQPAAPAPAQ